MFPSLTLPTQKFLSIIFNKPSYFIDEEISGQVELNNTIQLVLSEITLSLYLLENWLKLSSVPIGETNRQLILTYNLNIRQYLHISTSLVNLSPGKFVFYFRFKLPQNLNPCFEFPTTETKGYIRYSLDANIISPYIHGATSSYILLKSRQKNKPEQSIFSSSNEIYKWNMFSEGSTTLNVSLFNNDNNIKYGEKIKFNIDIDNTKGKLTASECKVVLMRKLELKARTSGDVKDTINNECVVQIFPTEVKPSEKKSFPCSINLEDMDKKLFNLNEEKLPYTNITNISFFIPSISSLILNCQYTLRVTLYFNSFVAYKHRPRVFIPINICHQSPEEFQNMNLSNQIINNNNNNIKNINEINSNSNRINQDNDDNELPSKEEIEKGNLEISNSDAPAPVLGFNNNAPNNSDGNNNLNVININSIDDI
jgi:hypothetical protein